MRLLIVILLVSTGLAGCTSSDAAEPDAPAPIDSTSEWRPEDTPEIREALSLDDDEHPAAVVVADLGPGANVYHERWQRPTWTHHPSDVIPGFPEDAVALHLTFTGDYESNFAADQEIWDSIEEGTLYWIPGTNLLGYVHRPYASVEPGHGSGENGFHGSGTTDAINQACPDCYVLYVQDSRSMDGDSVELMASWDWVDIVTSTNTPGPYYLPSGTYPYIGGSPNYAKATKALHDRGGLFVAATGNMPVNGLVNPTAPLPWYDYCCTPWVVNVGGTQSECAAGIALAGKHPEFVGDFMQELTDVQTTNETTYLQGTSFATPQVAGRFGATLLELRKELGDSRAPGVWWAGEPGPGPYLEDGVVTQEEVRAVLQSLGKHWSTADFDSESDWCTWYLYVMGNNLPETYNPTSFAHPVGPNPAVDLGWGYLDQDAPAAAASILLGGTDAPVRDVLTQETMALQMEWRRALRDDA